jgi:hypothetical protein
MSETADLTLLSGSVQEIVREIRRMRLQVDSVNARLSGQDGHKTKPRPAYGMRRWRRNNYATPNGPRWSRLNLHQNPRSNVIAGRRAGDWTA